MDSKSQRTLGNSMIADSDSSEDSDAKPFSPAAPDRNHYLPEIVSECPSSAISRKISDGFREVEISTQDNSRRFTPDRNRIALRTVAEADGNILNSSSVIFDREHSYDNETFLDDDSRTVSLKGGNKVGPSERNVETPLSRNGSRKINKKPVGLVLDKLKDDCKKKLAKPSEDDNLSRKYGVSMSVKSGVMRTPWRRGGSSEESNGDCSGSNGNGDGSASLKRSLTEETVLPSTSSSADSVLRSNDLDKIMDAPEEDADTAKIIPTVSKVTEEKDKTIISAVSIATYNNIQKKEIFKRGNCILCVTATVTFIVTIVLTVAILIAPKTLSTTEDQKPRALVLTVTSADGLVKVVKNPAIFRPKSLLPPLNKTVNRTAGGHLVSNSKTIPKR